MKRMVKRRSQKAGLPPGTPVFVGHPREEEVYITVIDYSPREFRQQEITRVEELLPYRDSATVTWINIAGLHQVEVLEQIRDYFHIHPLALEDILNTYQPPRVDVFEDHLFVLLKMIRPLGAERPPSEERLFLAEHVGIVILPGVVLTFQETRQDVLDPVRQRLKEGKGHIRQRGSDYLSYAIMDVIVDHYFGVLELIGDRLEILEGVVLEATEKRPVEEIYHLRRELIRFRRALWPLREVIGRLQREETPLVKSTTLPFLRDLYDHVIQVIDTLETYREMATGILDIHLTIVSNKMNEVMKILTIIATIFIPLSFLAGVYGMN
ncbi:MAG: magnesium and cobalt transport protein CorA, partial [Calditrichaeota bacterium]